VISPSRSITSYLQQFASRQVTSRELVEEALAAIANPVGEGARAFTRVYAESARITADAIDRRRGSGAPAGPLNGIPISVKDLFDVAGEPTPAGSVVLADAAPAAADATVVARLRQAGAILMGRTNMTEFAFSALGINPHYGTPRNPFDRTSARIPGGSSSGGAISVTDGMAVGAIGSDTGGSIRMPAALCGLTGFKPTARRVSMTGVLPLSPSLDSVGPIAPTVECCSILDAVLSGTEPQPLDRISVSDLRIGVLQGYVLDALEAPVANAFSNALSILSRAGAQITDFDFPLLRKLPEWNQKGGFAAPESYAWHRSLIEEHGDRYDPRVRPRILRGKEMAAVDYVELLHHRQEIIAAAEQAFAGFDAVILPTVPRIAPRIADLEASEAAYYEANTALLRNPSIFNFLDGCALSIPCHLPGDPPVGLMVAGLGGWDAQVLRAGLAIETALGQGR
jgi:aspartyl-tRNA(Asn)/glutamyl-tRNA(Gln) amidotransferase subunit A